MKKIINGKKYDTTTAMKCGSYEYGCGGVMLTISMKRCIGRKPVNFSCTEKEELLLSIVGTVARAVTREERLSLL